MLVCRGMEHNLRMVCPESEIKAGHLPHITDNRLKIQLRKPFLQFLADIMHRTLGIVEQYQLFHAKTR